MPGPRIHPSRAANFVKTKTTIKKSATKKPKGKRSVFRKRKPRNAKRRGPRRNAKAGNGLTRMARLLQPFMDADQAAKLWVAHLNDPWNYPPVSLGRTSVPTGVARVYNTQILSSATTYDSFIIGFNPIGIAQNTSFTYSYYDLGSVNNWSNGSSVIGNQSWNNYTASSAISYNYRPISCSARLQVRYAATTIPPYLFGGIIPGGGCIDVGRLGGTSGGYATSAVTYGSPMTVKVPGGSIYSNWEPQDFNDISEFSTAWGNGTFTGSSSQTTVPFIGAIGVPTVANNMTVEIDYLCFYQYEQNYGDTQYTTTMDDAVNYSSSELWDRYLIHKNKLKQCGKPKWTSIHAAVTAHIGKADGEKIMFAEQPTEYEQKHNKEAVEYKGSAGDAKNPIDGGIQPNFAKHIKMRYNQVWDTLSSLITEWGPTAAVAFNTYNRYHGNGGLRMLHVDMQDGIHDELRKKIEGDISKLPKEYETKIDDQGQAKRVVDSWVTKDQLLELRREDLVDEKGFTRLKCAEDHIRYKEITDHIDSDFDNIHELSESTLDLQKQQEDISAQLAKKLKIYNDNNK